MVSVSPPTPLLVPVAEVLTVSWWLGPFHCSSDGAKAVVGEALALAAFLHTPCEKQGSSSVMVSRLDPGGQVLGTFGRGSGAPPGSPGCPSAPGEGLGWGPTALVTVRGTASSPARKRGRKSWLSRFDPVTDTFSKRQETSLFL